jgi:hypothetical protein
MMKLLIKTAKLNVVFRQGELPPIDVNDPRFVLDLDGVEIQSKINSKAARKLKDHTGGAVLQGRLVVENGQLTLLDCGFQFLDPKPEVSKP